METGQRHRELDLSVLILEAGNQRRAAMDVWPSSSDHHQRDTKYRQSKCHAADYSVKRSQDQLRRSWNPGVGSGRILRAQLALETNGIPLLCSIGHQFAAVLIRTTQGTGDRLDKRVYFFRCHA